ncbi:hypothetical protein CCR94_01710 [Rhodoblastus sphagnicola]|uniref:Uncharacterized protein n=1 Tax=Rhodoblastus sphagnicola TaxID=333368 RepID=A0A2S6NFQ4_9HYPH|nr:Fic family protein [Rhodoblastus sphagnicola]MBB4197388.1 Fic family protein [Rhodoblastus sphagnicola]PPQ33458.1 hypothetical protein CCR94_01710 [Rhodoblastus sphagnicola]
MIDLGNPRTIKISSDTTELLAQIDGSLAEFNKLRPLDRDTEVRIKMAFLPDRVTASLNMEGIIATRRQTLAVLDAMTLNENSSKTEQEILNALEADEYTFEGSQDIKGLSEHFIREINALIERRIGEAPGAFRLRDISISQAVFKPPSHYEVPQLITRLVDIYNNGGFEHAVVGAVWLHNRFTYIHPFLDGNGRTGRLLQDYCLLKGGLFPTGIPSAKRDDYYDALASADANDWNPLIQIVALRELEVIAKAFAVANERQERSAWIKALARKASDKKAGALYKQYLVWSHKMSEIRAVFEYAAREFNEASEFIIVHIDNFDLIDFSVWKEICERGHSTKTWSFSLTFQVENQRLFKYVFYFRRHKFNRSDIFNSSAPIVGLFVTGGAYEDKYEFSGKFVDSGVRLREVLFFHEETYEYIGIGEYDKDLHGHFVEITTCNYVDDINLIVQKFFEDILLKKIGI